MPRRQSLTSSLLVHWIRSLPIWPLSPLSFRLGPHHPRAAPRASTVFRFHGSLDPSHRYPSSWTIFFATPSLGPRRWRETPEGSWPLVAIQTLLRGPDVALTATAPVAHVWTPGGTLSPVTASHFDERSNYDSLAAWNFGATTAPSCPGAQPYRQIIDTQQKTVQSGAAVVNWRQGLAHCRVHGFDCAGDVIAPLHLDDWWTPL